MDLSNFKLDIQFLASLVNNPSVLSDLPKETLASDFSDPVFYDIYIEIVGMIMAEKPISYNDLKFKFKADVIALSIIEEINDESYVDNINLVYNDLCEKSKKRQLIKVGNIMCSQAKGPSSSSDIINRAEGKLLQITSTTDVKTKSISDLEGNFISELSDKVKKFRTTNSISSVVDLPTGLSRLDYLTLGLHKKNTTVIGAGTSDGKTQLAVQITNTIITNQKSVLYFMLEDAGENLLCRLISLRTSISIHKIRCGDLTNVQVTKIQNCLSTLKGLNKLTIDDTTIDINELITKVKFTKLKKPDLEVVFVDYIGLAVDRSENYANRERELASISKKLLQLGKECNIAVVVLVQVGTSPEERGKGLPIRMNDIRDCKAIGHDSSICIFVHCPNKYNENMNFSREHSQIIIAKNRYGECNKVIDLTSRGDIGYFTEGAPKK